MTMVQSANSLTTPPNTGSTFRSRLFHYAIGLSIGCLMTGALISARYKAAQAQAAERAARAEAAAAQARAAEEAATGAVLPAPAPNAPAK